jgi:hypothetical protein
MAPKEAPAHLAIFPFLVGFGRSGTTLLRAALDAHPEMAVPPESHFVLPMILRRRRYESPSGLRTHVFLDDLFAAHATRLAVRWGLTREDVESVFKGWPPNHLGDAIRAVYIAYARKEGKSRYGDKTPVHVLSIPLLATVFPIARFVHIIRDGRDATLSYLDQWWGPESVTEGALRWKRAVRAGQRAGNELGSQRYIEVRYEEMVSDLEAVLRRLCPFLYLRFDTAMLRYHERAERLIAQTDRSHAGLRHPPSPGFREWRRQMSYPDLVTFEVLAGDVLSQLGYERAVLRATTRARVTSAIRWFAYQAGRVARKVAKAVRKLFKKTESRS